MTVPEQYEVRVTDGRVLSFEAVGKQKDRNAFRSGALIGGWLEMTKLPLPLGRYIITSTTAVGVLEI
ncbi:hypothetical protein Tco_0095190 [Tanacetum coccineum]